jgi:hypothetical protein
MRKRIALAVAALVAIGAVLLVHQLRPLGRLGSGYAAKQTCSCMFVSGRTLDSCRTDLDPLALKLVRLHVGSDDVRASVGGVWSARARFDAARGCSLVE